MKVTISVGAKFHAFHLAEQLQKRGALQRIITGYPRFKLRNEAVAPERIVPVLLPTLMGQAVGRVPLLRDKMPMDHWQAAWFDALASRHVRECDIFVGWATYVLNSIRRAKSRGVITLVERHSAHVLVQQQILREEYERQGMPWKPLSSALIERQLREYEEADYISVPSTFVGDTFVRMGMDPRRIVRVTLGVDAKRFFLTEAPDETFRIIFVGGICLRKGVHYLLQAVHELKLPHSELLLIGGIDKDIKPFLEKYSGSYTYGGILPQAQLPNHYARSSLFVLPSVEEGFGMVVSEAMACGLPVIVSENAGAQDIVRNGTDGFILPVRNVEALKEKIYLLYQDKDLRRAMGRSAQKRAAEFTWDRYGEAMLGAYGRILGQLPNRTSGYIGSEYKYGTL